MQFTLIEYYNDIFGNKSNAKNVKRIFATNIKLAFLTFCHIKVTTQIVTMEIVICSVLQRSSSLYIRRI